MRRRGLEHRATRVVKKRGGFEFEKRVPLFSVESFRELQAFWLVSAADEGEEEVEEEEDNGFSCSEVSLKTGRRNIVKLFSSSLDEKNAFFRMEYSSLNLRQLLEGGSMSEEGSLRVAGQVLSGLSFLHTRNLIHRDLKPENILFSSGVAKIADFGLSCLHQEGEARTPGLITLWYRPPEMLEGRTDYDERVDVWSVGCILWEMLKGSPIFPGSSEIEMLSMIRDRELPSSLLNDFVSPSSKRDKLLRKSIRREKRRSSHHLLKTLMEM